MVTGKLIAVTHATPLPPATKKSLCSITRICYLLIKISEFVGCFNYIFTDSKDIFSAVSFAYISEEAA